MTTLTLKQPAKIETTGTNLEILEQINDYIKENFLVLWYNALMLCDNSRSDGYRWSNEKLNLNVKKEDYYSSLKRIEWYIKSEDNTYHTVRINQCGVKQLNQYHWEKNTGVNFIKNEDLELLVNLVNSIAVAEVEITPLKLVIEQ